MKLEIKKIRIDGGTQPRSFINQDVVAEYAEQITDGAVMPAVTVFFDGVYYWLADGFHRYFAHKKAGFTEIEIDQHTGTVRDAILYSVGANNEHGLRRTNEDKRKAVLVLLEDMEWSEWSDHLIAKQCRVSHMTVGRIKKSLQLDQPNEKKYINKHGKESKIDVSKNKPEVTTLQPAEQAIAEHTEEDKFMELAVEHEALAEENAKLLDKLAVKNMDASPEEKQKAQETLDELRGLVKQYEAEIRALTTSRNQFQAENAELKKQVKYWRNKTEKLAA